MRPYSSRVMVLPLADPGSSVTTNVLPAEREVTRVCTFTLPNSVIRHWGIPSVKLRSSSGEGFWWTVRASTSNGYSFDHSTIVGPGRSLVADEGLDSTRGPRPPGCRERATRRAGTDAMELTEEELVEAIRKVLSGELPGVQVGIGDDAAVVGSRGQVHRGERVRHRGHGRQSPIRDGIARDPRRRRRRVGDGALRGDAGRVRRVRAGARGRRHEPRRRRRYRRRGGWRGWVGARRHALGSSTRRHRDGHRVARCGGGRVPALPDPPREAAAGTG